MYGVLHIMYVLCKCTYVHVTYINLHPTDNKDNLLEFSVYIEEIESGGKTLQQAF